jgi:hypothetical protein
MADLREADLFGSLEQQQNHWYYHAKLSAIRSALQRSKQRIPCTGVGLAALDIGAGNGIISRSLPLDPHGQPWRWWLVDTGYSNRDLHNCEPGYTLLRHPPDHQLFDLIVAIDVVEHVSDDAGFMRDLSCRLRPGGLLIACVPAFRFLWSRHDVVLGHCRRYRRGGFARLIQASGLQLLSSTYLYILLFPLVLFRRLLSGSEQERSDLAIYPGPVNRSLRWVMALERRLERVVPAFGRLPGLSCLVVAIRPTVDAQSPSPACADEEDRWR